MFSLTDVIIYVIPETDAFGPNIMAGEWIPISRPTRPLSWSEVYLGMHRAETCENMYKYRYTSCSLNKELMGYVIQWVVQWLALFPRTSRTWI